MNGKLNIGTSKGFLVTQCVMIQQAYCLFLAGVRGPIQVDQKTWEAAKFAIGQCQAAYFEAKE